MILYLLPLYWGLMLLSCGLAIYRFRAVQTPTKILCILIFWGMLSETVARQVAKISGNNQWVYNIAMGVEWALVCLYFNYSISRFKQYGIGLWLSVCVLLYCIFHIINTTPENGLNYSILYGACISILFLSAYAIYRFLTLERQNIVLQKKVHFWVPWLLILYQGCALWAWATFPHFATTSREAALVLQQVLLSNCIVYYAGLFIILYQYPKLKETYGR